MTEILAVPVAAPLLAAAVAVVLRSTAARRILTAAAIGIHLAVAAYLIVATSDGSVIAAQIGAWPAPFAIAFVADTFSALMLAVSGFMVAACIGFAAARREDEGAFYHPLVLVLTTGVSGSFLTADLFNLFVFFEVMLIASYVLLVLGTSREQLRGGAVYVSTNLLASTILVGGVALTYGAAGTVNMAELGGITATSPTVAVAGALLLIAFAIKASLVPLHGWIGVSYPVAPPAAAALFSLLTKVGVYALYRVYAVVFGGDPAFRNLLLVIAAVTMLGGVLAAVGREDMRGILSFHITSQVGYMVLGLALFGPLGLAAGIFYILHNIVVKTGLFLAAGAVETLDGSGRLADLSGVARRRPVLATAFALVALSIVGVPPLGGFAAKLGLLRETFAQAEYALGAVAVVVSFLTLVSMAKIWNGVFWGSDRPPPGIPPRLSRAAVVAPALVLAILAAVVGAGAQGLYDLTSTAAAGLVDPGAYTRAVLGR